MAAKFLLANAEFGSKREEETREPRFAALRDVASYGPLVWELRSLFL